MKMSRIRRICALAAAAIALALPAAALAQPDLGGFTITSYEVNVTVSENNAYDVSETIAVNFTEPRHGIYREIPMRGEWVRDAARGGSTEWSAQVSDVRVEGYEFTAECGDPDAVVKIGSADTTVEGEQVYRISYRVRFSGDDAPDFDEVCYNIIGDGWDTTIDAVTFSVTLPKAFDQGVAGFSMGPAGTSGYAPGDLEFSVDGNTIAGKTLRPLRPHEALTLRVELPQGYFIPSGVSAEAVPEVSLSDGASVADGPQPVGGIQLGPRAGILAGGGVILLGFGAMAVIVVLAVVLGRGRGGAAAGGRLNRTMADRMNRQNQLDQMNQLNQMNQTNQQPPTWTDANSGGFTGGGGDSGGGSGGGGGGSW